MHYIVALAEVGSISWGQAGKLVVCTAWRLLGYLVRLLQLVTTYVSCIHVFYGHICIACVCVCVQISIFLSQWFYFIKTSLNNILPLPYAHQIVWEALIERICQEWWPVGMDGMRESEEFMLVGMIDDEYSSWMFGFNFFV